MALMTSPIPVRQVEMMQHAWANPALKQELLTDPKTVIGREMGEFIPDFIDIKVLAETTRRWWLIVPPRPDTLPEAEPDHANIGGLKPNELQSPPERAAAVQEAFQKGEIDTAQLLRAVIQQGLIERAWAKDGFLQEILVDAKARVVEVIADLGLPIAALPADLEIRALEETATRRYMLLPANPDDGLTGLEAAVADGLSASGNPKFIPGTSAKWRSTAINAWGFSLALHGITLPYCGAFAHIKVSPDQRNVSSNNLTVCTLTSSDPARSLQVNLPL